MSRKRKDGSDERRRYPKDKEAWDILVEARRRKGEELYYRDDNASIIRLMMDESRKVETRILYGPLNGKAKGQGRKQINPKDEDGAKDKAIKLWGSYLSEFITWHPMDEKGEGAVEPFALRPPRMGPRWPVGRPVPYGPRLKECRPPSACYACAIRREGRCRVPDAVRLSGPYRTDRRAEPSAVKPSARDRSAEPSAVTPSGCDRSAEPSGAGLCAVEAQSCPAVDRRAELSAAVPYAVRCPLRCAVGGAVGGAVAQGCAAVLLAVPSACRSARRAVPLRCPRVDRCAEPSGGADK